MAKAKDSANCQAVRAVADTGEESIVLNATNQWKGESSQMYRSTMTITIGLVSLKGRRLGIYSKVTGTQEDSLVTNTEIPVGSRS